MCCTVSAGYRYSYYLSSLDPNAAKPKESYIYFTDCSVTISDIDHKTNYQYDYDNNYSLVSKPIDNFTVFFRASLSGYIDPLSTFNNISITPYILSEDGVLLEEDFQICNIEESKINPDGTFRYIATYSAPVPNYIHNFYSYSISDISFS